MVVEQSRTAILRKLRRMQCNISLLDRQHLIRGDMSRGNVGIDLSPGKRVPQRGAQHIIEL